MPATYEPIATTTLGSAQSSVTFSTISGSYTDLVLIVAATTDTLKVQFNSDTGSNYSRTYIYGDGSSATSGRSTSGTFFYIAGGSPSATLNYIQNYSNTTTYKTVLSRGNAVSNGVDASVSLWRSTSAITSITLTPNSGTIASGSVLTLYGIKAA